MDLESEIEEDRHGCIGCKCTNARQSGVESHQESTEVCGGCDENRRSGSLQCSGDAFFDWKVVRQALISADDDEGIVNAQSQNQER